MIEMIIPATAAVIIMIVFVFFIFKNIAKRINNNAKKHFVEKLQSYDYMIAEKVEELNNLQQQIEKLQKQIEEKSLEQVVKEEEKKVDIVYNIPTPEYREDAFFRNYKDLQKLFDIDGEEIVKDFISKHKSTKSREYAALLKVKSYFDKESIYNCVTLDIADQKEIIREVISDKEKTAIDLDNIIENIKDFNIIKFLEYIDEQIEKKNPTVYVYVGRKDINYDYIANNIKTEFYRYMSEGVIIQYQEKIYDYSI